MKIDLGLISLNLPDAEPLAPVMFIAMGDKDEAAALAVGPTMAKTKPQQFRRTLSVNVMAMTSDEPPEKAIARSTKDLISRVKGQQISTKPMAPEGADGAVTEYTHPGQARMNLRSLCWVGVKERWIFTLNLTALDSKTASKSLHAQMSPMVASVGF